MQCTLYEEHKMRPAPPRESGGDRSQQRGHYSSHASV